MASGKVKNTSLGKRPKLNLLKMDEKALEEKLKLLWKDQNANQGGQKGKLKKITPHCGQCGMRSNRSIRSIQNKGGGGVSGMMNFWTGCLPIFSPPTDSNPSAPLYFKSMRTVKKLGEVIDILEKRVAQLEKVNRKRHKHADDSEKVSLRTRLKDVENIITKLKKTQCTLNEAGSPVKIDEENVGDSNEVQEKNNSDRVQKTKSSHKRHQLSGSSASKEETFLGPQTKDPSVQFVEQDLNVRNEDKTDTSFEPRSEMIEKRKHVEDVPIKNFSTASLRNDAKEVSSIVDHHFKLRDEFYGRGYLVPKIPQPYFTDSIKQLTVNKCKTSKDSKQLTCEDPDATNNEFMQPSYHEISNLSLASSLSETSLDLVNRESTHPTYTKMSSDARDEQQSNLWLENPSSSCSEIMKPANLDFLSRSSYQQIVLTAPNQELLQTSNVDLSQSSILDPPEQTYATLRMGGNMSESVSLEQANRTEWSNGTKSDRLLKTEARTQNLNKSLSSDVDSSLPGAQSIISLDIDRSSLRISRTSLTSGEEDFSHSKKYMDKPRFMEGNGHSEEKAVPAIAKTMKSSEKKLSWADECQEGEKRYMFSKRYCPRGSGAAIYSQPRKRKMEGERINRFPSFYSKSTDTSELDCKVCDVRWNRGLRKHVKYEEVYTFQPKKKSFPASCDQTKQKPKPRKISKDGLENPIRRNSVNAPQKRKQRMSTRLMTRQVE